MLIWGSWNSSGSIKCHQQLTLQQSLGAWRRSQWPCFTGEEMGMWSTPSHREVSRQEGP